MARNRKTVLKNFSYLQCDDFAAYLSQMAAKGWHFKAWKAGLVFEKGEPETVQYAVEVFIDGSEYDTRPDVHTQAFAEYCEVAGWELIDAKRKFVIFKKIRDDAVEILTPLERLENIAKEERKDVLYKLILAYTWVFLLLSRFTGSLVFVQSIYSGYFLLLCAVWLVLAICATFRFFHFLVWKKNWKKRVAYGEALYFGKGKNPFTFTNGWHTQLSTGVILVFVACLFLTKQFETLLLILGLVVVLVTVAFVIARLRPDAVIHQIIQIVVAVLLMITILIVPITIFASDETIDVETAQIPFYYDEVDEKIGRLEEAEFHQRSSIFGSAMSCQMEYEEEYVYYYVYTSDQPWVIDKIWKELVIDDYHTMEEDATDLWNAELAYKTGLDTYSVKYPDAVLIMNFAEGTVLTSEKVDIICAALLESR